MNTLTLLSDAKYFDEGNSRFAELRTMLDSKHSKEKLEAMKRLMAMITIGRDVSSFFPDVVKNIVVESQGQWRTESIGGTVAAQPHGNGLADDERSDGGNGGAAGRWLQAVR